MIDDCMVEMKRIGFARVCVKADFSLPLRLGVGILDSEISFWQKFIFENLNGLYLYYGRLHLLEVYPTCRGGAVSRREEVLRSVVVLEEMVGDPCLGPWMVVVH